MVLIDKTYSGARRISTRIMTAMMIIGGFITLVFVSSAKPLSFFGTHEIGVAHADVVDTSGTYNTTYVDAGCAGCGGCGGDGGGTGF